MATNDNINQEDLKDNYSNTGSDEIVLRDIGKEMQIRWNELEEQCKILRNEFIDDYLRIIGEDSEEKQELLDRWNAKTNALVLGKIDEMKKVLKYWMDIRVAGWLTPVYDIVEEVNL